MCNSLVLLIVCRNPSNLHASIGGKVFDTVQYLLVTQRINKKRKKERRREREKERKNQRIKESKNQRIKESKASPSTPHLPPSNHNIIQLIQYETFLLSSSP